VHNEQDNLCQLVQRVHHAMVRHFGGRWEQVLVDDGSTDNSAPLMRQLQGTYPRLKIYTHDTNRGECAAWKTAFDNSRGDVVVLLAADLQSQPEEIPQLVMLATGTDVDVASAVRLNRKDGFYYWCATRLLTFAMNGLFRLSVRDVSSSFFAVRSEFVKGLKLVQNDHRYILAIFRSNGARITEVPVEHHPRRAGHTHYRRSKVLYAIPEFLKFTVRIKSGFYRRP